MKKAKKAKIQNINSEKANFPLLIRLLLICAIMQGLGCNESVQSGSYKSKSGAGVKNLKPKAIKIIREGLADDDPRIRATAIEVVADTQQAKLMPRVERLLKDDFVPVRFAAALAVGDMQYSLAGKTVKHLLSSPDENSKLAAAYAINKLGSTENLEIIRKAIHSKDQTLRANAALLLGKSDDKDSLELLIWAQNDKDSDYKVKFQALEARARLGDEKILRRLWALVYSAYADDRIIAVKAMGALGTEKAKDILITKLDDDLLEVRLAAAEQIGMLGDHTGEPEVLDVFTKNLTAELNKKDREHVYMLTALAIGQIGTPELTEFLPQLLKSESKFVRIAAAKAVLLCIMRN